MDVDEGSALPKQRHSLFRDFFPQSSFFLIFFFRTKVNQTVCLYKVDPCGKVFVPCSSKCTWDNRMFNVF